MKEKNFYFKTFRRIEYICEDCNGSGIVVDVRLEPRCCMNFNELGGCCNYPVPDQVLEPRQCERCQSTGLSPN
jgi:hypothetical protein